MKKNKNTWGDVINVGVLLLFCAMCIYPVWYVFIGSISSPEVPTRTLALLPKDVTLFNYKEAFKVKGIFRATLVSVARTVIGTVVSVSFTSYMAYMFTQRRMPHRKFWYRLVVLSSYLGAGLIPYFLVLKSYGFVNTFWVYIIPGMLGVYNMILVKTFMENGIPESLPESAKLDGAGVFTTFWRIMLPLSTPILATIALYVAVGQWNSYFDNMVYNGLTDDYNTLQYILYKTMSSLNNKKYNISNAAASAVMQDIKGEMELTSDAFRMTLTMIITIPIVCVYPFVQRYFVKGIMIGAVKG